MKLNLTNIIIGERQRTDLGDLSDLDSMSDPDVGQIEPIIIHKVLDGYELVAGRRRLAKATQLGWTEIECLEKDQLTPLQKQKMELLEDIGRRNRSWQESCIAVAKVHRMIQREKGSTEWTIRQMALFTGIPKSRLAEMLTVAEELVKLPRDEELWNANGYTVAVLIINERNFISANLELEARRQRFNAQRTLLEPTKPAITWVEDPTRPGSGQMVPSYRAAALSAVPNGDQTAAALAVIEPPQPAITLEYRAHLYNQAFKHLGPPNTPLTFITDGQREFIHGFWFVGGGNVSEFYGSYQSEYLNRISALFPDCEGAENTLHLFSGSLPSSDKYTRVGQDPTGQYKSDIECDAHLLSTYLPFKPQLIYADPPYSKEDSEHYQNSMVNRAVILEQCGIVLKPGGYVVWMDQALPVFSNDQLQLVGAIGYVRSTGNRFRMITIFRKHETPPPPITKEYE